VASLSVLLWDILDNLKNDYQLLFRHRLGLPTIVSFLSRVSVLGFVIVTTIYMTTPSIACAAFEAVFIAFFIAGLVATLFLSYFRVCAVWDWNRFIVGFFGVSWLAVAASGFTLIHSLKGIPASDGGGYCMIISTPLNMAPVITSFFNHTVVFLAITYGVCRNTIGRDLTFRDCLRLMIGHSLPTFSKALLHDSQVCYIIMMGIAVTTIVWFHVWMEIQPDTSFRLVLVTPYVALVNILICRVFRNTKLGLYSKVPVQSNDSKSQQIDMVPWSSRTDVESDAVLPIQIEVSQVVEYKRDYPPVTGRKHGDYLDFGML